MGKKGSGTSDIKGARVLGLFGDKITTDHISPAGSIKAASPAGSYLLEHNGVGPLDFNQYGTRRGNHEVMMRGTFANIRIRNHMLGPNGKEGGYTIHYPSKEEDVDLRRRHAVSRQRAFRSSSSPVSNTATVRRATGRRRAPTCSASRPLSRSPSSVSTARTWSAWVSSPSSSKTARPGRALASRVTRPLPSRTWKTSSRARRRSPRSPTATAR